MLNDTFWNISAQALWSASSIITSIIIAKNFGPDGAGKIGYFVWLVTSIGVVTSLAVPQTLMRYHGEYAGSASDSNLKKLYRWALLWQLLLLVIGLGVLTLVISANEAIQTSNIGRQLAIVLFVVSQFGLLGRNILHGARQFRRFAFLSLWSMILQVGALWFIVYIEPTESIAIAAYIGSYLPYVFPVFGSIKYLVAQPREQTRTHKVTFSFWAYALPTWISLILAIIVTGKSELFFLRRYATSAEVAFFDAGFNMGLIPYQFAIMLTGALLPNFALIYGLGDWKRLETTFRLFTTLICAALVPICMFILVSSPLIIELFFGTEFADASIVLSVLILATATSVIAGTSATLLYSINRPRVITFFSIISAVLLMINGFTFVRVNGLLAAAVGKALVQSLVNLGIVAYVALNTPLSFPFKAISKIILVSILGALLAFGLTHYGAQLGALSLLVGMLPIVIAVYYLMRFTFVWNVAENKTLLHVVERMSRKNQVVQGYLEHLLALRR